MRVSFGRPSTFIGLAVERFGDEIGPAFRRLAELYVERPREVAAVLGSGTPTLVHGDAHLGNLFVDDADGGRPGFFDWAMVWRAGGLRDVAYVLGNSIPTDVRREGEREWIAALRRRTRRARGVTLERRRRVGAVPRARRLLLGVGDEHRGDGLAVAVGEASARAACAAPPPRSRTSTASPPSKPPWPLTSSVLALSRRPASGA